MHIAALHINTLIKERDSFIGDEARDAIDRDRVMSIVLDQHRHSSTSELFSGGPGSVQWLVHHSAFGASVRREFQILEAPAHLSRIK